jgi:hypothetical protein
VEDWKLQHYLTNFTEACEGDPHELIKHTKKLRAIMDKLNNPEQETDILDTVFPFMDDQSAAVRQCAACIVMNMPIERFSTMPPNLDIQRYDATGKLYYDSHWENKVPEAKQQTEWEEFVAKHKLYIKDHGGRRSL